MRQSWRALWHEPRPDDAPARVWRDWALVAGFSVAALLEGILAPDVPWRPFATVLAIGLTPLLLWRRTHPLATIGVGFGAVTAVQLVAVSFGRQEVGLASMLYFLILVYALTRWGSGREVVIGLAIVMGVATTSLVTTPGTAGDVIGAYTVLLLAAGSGAILRYRATADRREREQIRSEERVGLARDLHDVVAHHVSAIAVQAQMGRTVGTRDPAVALEALASIEDEASRALAQMRAMVGVLRTGTPVEYAPVGGVAALPSLAQTDARPAVAVRVDGDPSALPPTVDHAVFRLAQESLTNARRHARDVTRIEVDVAVEPQRVLVRVRDDGAADPLWQPGYGIVGMTERAEMLGGTLTAGPTPGGGWLVSAELPLVSLA
jgi:signal transduction histidine kinase